MRSARAPQTLVLLVSVFAGVALGCAKVKPFDYRNYVSEDPHSILIVPVVNNSAEVGAADYFLATITVPLAERGYYVFPVNMTRELLADAGLSDPGLAREVGASRVAELFGADSVLFVSITNWEAKYMVITTQVTVGFEYHLVSGRTGEELWSTKQKMVYQPQNNSSGNPLADLVVMAVTAAVTKAAPNYMPLARQANGSVAAGTAGGSFVIHHPLLPGPHHAAYGQDRAARRSKLGIPVAGERKPMTVRQLADRNEEPSVPTPGVSTGPPAEGEYRTAGGPEEPEAVEIEPEPAD